MLKDDTKIDQEKHLLAEGMRILQRYFDKQEESQKREKKSARFDRWGITITTLVVSLIGASITMYQFSAENALKRKFQYTQDVQTQTRQQIQFLDTQIRDKIIKRDNLNNTISKARNLIEVGHLYCKNGQFSGDKFKYGEQQLDALYLVINASYSINQIFDPNTVNKVRYFITLLDENRNICDKQGDFDMNLRLLQREINMMTNDSISVDQKKKEELFSQLTKSPLEK